MRAITPGELIEELKSGRWRKARKQLAKSTNHRCCLGVACELIGVEWDQDAAVWGTGWGGSGVNPDRGTIPFDVVGTYAPWLTGKQHSLAGINDRVSGWDRVIEILEGISA